MNEELRERLQKLLKRTNDVLQLPVTCPKCHGKGSYIIPTYENFDKSRDEWETNECEVCKGTGKVTLEFYEDIQKNVRMR